MKYVYFRFNVCFKRLEVFCGRFGCVLSSLHFYLFYIVVPLSIDHPSWKFDRYQKTSFACHMSQSIGCRTVHFEFILIDRHYVLIEPLSTIQTGRFTGQPIDHVKPDQSPNFTVHFN